MDATRPDSPNRYFVGDGSESIELRWIAIVGAMTDPVETSTAGDEDETAFWLSVPGLSESLAEADADRAAGRTYGEEEIRADYGLTPRSTG